MLLQIDGSRHDWLEGCAPYFTLIGGIDDATGKVPYALFREQEDAQGYFLLLEPLVRTVGRPLAVYRDRHGIFERSTKERLTLAEQLKGKPDPTQFGRLLEELEIRSIAARSPQAKGRIEEEDRRSLTSRGHSSWPLKEDVLSGRQHSLAPGRWSGGGRFCWVASVSLGRPGGKLAARLFRRESEGLRG